MPRTSFDYVRALEDSKNILTPLLRILIQKKPVSVEDACVAISSTVRKVMEAVNAQVGAFILLDPKTHQRRIKGLYHAPNVHGDGLLDHRLIDEALRQHRDTVLPAETIKGTQLAINETLFCADEQTAKSCLNHIMKSIEIPIQSLIAIPVKAEHTYIGHIEFINRFSEERRAVFFSEEDLKLAEDAALYCGRVMARALNPTLVATDKEMADYIARMAKCEQASELGIHMHSASTIGVEKLKQYLIAPLAVIKPNTLRAAVVNPLDFRSIDDFENLSGFKIAEKLVTTEREIREALAKAFPENSPLVQVAERVAKEYDVADFSNDALLAVESDENSALVINLTNRIIENAYQEGASDIHIEPAEQNVRVRYRIDGVCRVKLSLPKATHRLIISRIKIMSDLDIAEHRLPQDGKINYKKFNLQFDLDLRVSIAPMHHGESVVMRILDKQKSTLPLDKLGFSEYNLELYNTLLQAPYGMILHCGPTGSGKSMTLYAALNKINSPEWKILTAEDPIEYTLPGINQMQMKKDIGLTFAHSLRCFLRQDPDIILVGEIRDKETAEVALEASLTGHLLFSTLHTNDAASTIVRLVEIGVEPFLIATTLVGICAQRLVRRLCTCKCSDTPTQAELLHLQCAKDANAVGQIYRPVGCKKCEESGYKGRTGIHEILKASDALRNLITSKASSEALKEHARLNGMRTLFEDAMEKVKAGISSIPESLATAKPDDSLSQLAKSSETVASAPQHGVTYS